MNYFHVPTKKNARPVAAKRKGGRCQSAGGDDERKSSKLNATRVRASWLAASWTVLALATSGQALAWTGQPLAYVTSGNGISVIDTGDNKVVDTIPGLGPAAVTPDGKQLYAFGPNNSDFVWNVFVIDAANDQVVTTVPLDVSLVSGGVSLNGNSMAIAAAPDGKHVYVNWALFECILRLRSSGICLFC